ncbi:hypothetical protein J437_LFUL009560 [Ladona fulva]|uniref:Uncharacterized protein n=1 Tax=Ladona fulva TaxID=123851 RepID=A0A8K0K749_LADFU|nr:hypothetical protein J437_LFUL009560 [Ladona fulva]
MEARHYPYAPTTIPRERGPDMRFDPRYFCKPPGILKSVEFQITLFQRDLRPHNGESAFGHNGRGFELRLGRGFVEALPFETFSNASYYLTERNDRILSEMRFSGSAVTASWLSQASMCTQLECFYASSHWLAPSSLRASCASTSITWSSTTTGYSGSG